MKGEFATLLRMRTVFRASGAGRGLAAALVEAFSSAGWEDEVARAILLGTPPQIALAPLLEGNAELATLTSLLINSAGASTRLVGVRGEDISVTVERWLKRSEARGAERRVMQMRGLIMSGVLGAVVSILASLGPLVGNAGFLWSGVATPSGSLLVPCGAMVAVSSAMLGLFLSGRRFYVNVLVALALYSAAAVAIGPLASVATLQPLGII